MHYAKLATVSYVTDNLKIRTIVLRLDLTGVIMMMMIPLVPNGLAPAKANVDARTAATSNNSDISVDFVASR